MKKNTLLFWFTFILKMVFSQSPDYSIYVNPMIGTGGHGHTYPGAVVPFGMVQLSPDTRLDGWDGCSGYHYSDSIIYGFSHTHLSGTGCLDYGDILLMPFTGTTNYKNKEYCSPFSHKDETASPGFYSVLLSKYKIKVELTTTKRTGYHKYTFPAKNNAKVLLDLLHRDEVIDSYLEIVSNTEIKGHRRSKSWAKDQYIYFHIRFSAPFSAYEIIQNDDEKSKAKIAGGNNIKASFTFNNLPNNQLFAQVGISMVNTDGALKNLNNEAKELSFENALKQAKEEWNKELGKIEIKGGTKDQKTIFYTALYHTMVVPNIASDVDGNYRGMDNKIHKANGFTYYSVFSLWDTFRAAHPLYTMIDKQRTLDFIKTFLVQYEQGGRLPVWELSSNETDCMIGYHSVSVIFDAAIKGITGFDLEKAFEAMKKSATWNHLGLPAYIDHGYLAMEDEHESVSKTLEYAYDDWCIAQMAKLLNKTDDYNNYIKRAQSYKNIFDAQTGFMRPRKNGNWLSPFDPREVNNNFTEANSWQYSFFVPHDISGLINLYGSKENFEKKLDELFATENKTTGRDQVDITGLIGQYAHGNEPSHHMAYLYNFIGKPWKTQERVNQLLNEMYHNTPDGLIGNEDCGQMSAWYVLSALGIYSVTPGAPMFVIGKPLFDDVKINLENDKNFTINTSNLSEKNIYIQSAALNNKPYFKSYIHYSDIINGGALQFQMGNIISEKNGTKEGDFPITNIQETQIVSVPVIISNGTVFKEKTAVKIESSLKNCKIYFTTNRTNPDITSKFYTSEFTIDSTTTIKAITVNSKNESSYITTATLHKFPNNWSVKLISKYSSQYSAGGDEGLIDGIKGDENWRKGDWQGYQGQDFEAVIDFGSEKLTENYSASFLQDSRSWIIFPTNVEFSFSLDGKKFFNAAEKTNTIPANDNAIQRKEFSIHLSTPIKARYAKVKAKNFGKLPQWHQGAGFDAFIFIDEIEIK